MEERIIKLRQEIDKIDSDILHSITKRTGLVLKILEQKKNSEISQIHYPKREQAIIDNICKNNTSALSNNTVTKIFTALIEGSRQLQQDKLDSN